jgi:hypothetical protein
VAYAQIDATYRARRINESARELAKWYIRCCCGVWKYHNLTQAEQAAQFGVSRRTIITLVQQLVDAEIIWLERHGSANRTYITAYQAPLHADDVAADEAPPTEIHEPTYDALRARADAALAQGDTARAAQLMYQTAMLLARQANAGAVLFSPPTGDPPITDHVQAGSPGAYIKDSGIPCGDTESSVCSADGGDGDSSPQRNEDATPTLPDTEATRLLRSFGVASPALLRRHAAAPPELIHRAEARRAEQGYSAGLIGRILDDGGVIWGRSGQRVENSAPAPALDDDDAGHRKYTRGALGRYIKTGLHDPPPGDTAPVDDPELVWCRSRGLPWWSDGEAP